MNIKQNLNEAINILKEKAIENPVMHARLLMEFVIGKSKEYIITHDSENMEKEKEEKYFNSVKRLADGEPFQYITNHQEFMKVDFYVDSNVLIPRADTEILVEEVITAIKNMANKRVKVLDMCTGSGAIAISIATYIENAEVYAVDLSENALKVAEKNATNNKVEHKCKFMQSNMFGNINEKFDIIVSNPPYIKTEEIASLDKKVQKEPLMALDGGKTGLEFYEILTENSYKYLNENGMLFMEIGYDQKDSVTNLLEQNGKYCEIYAKKDLGQNDRLIVAKKK